MDIGSILAILLALLIGAVAVGLACFILAAFVLCMRVLWRSARGLWKGIG